MASTYQLRKRIEGVLKEAEAATTFLRGELQAKFDEGKKDRIKMSGKRYRTDHRHENCLTALDNATRALSAATAMLERGGKDA